MRKVVITALTAAVTCACSESTRTPATPTELTAPLQVQAAQPDGIAKNHDTHLSGDQEVFLRHSSGTPTPADSRAQGQAHFMVSDDGQVGRLQADRLEHQQRVHGAHPLRCARHRTGRSSCGCFRAPIRRRGRQVADVMTVSWPKARSPTPTSFRVPPATRAQAACRRLADVLAKIEAHGTYVNVHTTDGERDAERRPRRFPGWRDSGPAGQVA